MQVLQGSTPTVTVPFFASTSASPGSYDVSQAGTLVSGTGTLVQLPITGSVTWCTIALSAADTSVLGDLLVIVLDTGFNFWGCVRLSVVASLPGGDPLANPVPGSYAAGTAGNVLGTFLDATVSSRSTYDGGPVESVTDNVNANVVEVNGVTVNGAGTATDPWGP
jgi:hypothetical protein